MRRDDHLGRAVALLCVLAAAGAVIAHGAPETEPPDCAVGQSDADAVAAARAACTDLDACLAALVAAAEPSPYGGVSVKEEAASSAVLAFGAAAVPPLLSLLEHDGPDVRRLAAFTLRNAPVTEKAPRPVDRSAPAGRTVGCRGDRADRFAARR